MIGNMGKQNCDMKRGDRIRDIRDKIGLSQDEAASGMHISRQALSSIENGRDFRISTLNEMMNIYNVTADEIMTDIYYGGDSTDIIGKINRELEKLDRKVLEYLYISLYSINHAKEVEV